MIDWLKNKKAISPILALLIVLGVTIVVGAVFYAWGSGLFNNSQQKTESALEGTTTTMAYDAGAIGVAVPKEIDVEGDLDLGDVLQYYYYGVLYNSSDASKYKLNALAKDSSWGTLYDERIIVPVPISLENYYDSALTNVKIESDGTNEVAGLTLKKITLNYNGQSYDAYLLCTNDGTPFKGILNRTGIYPDATWVGDDGNNYTSVYYILAPNSVTKVAAVNDSKDLSVTDVSQWGDSTHRQSMRLYAGGFNNFYYACAVNGSYSGDTLTATKFIGWNTGFAFNKYITPIDAKFYTSEWDVGTLHSRERVSKDIYFFFGSSMGFQEETSGVTTVNIPVKVVSDQGAYKQVDVKIVLKDRL
ncbi:conserved hypothetical protein [Methanocaldococcus sp. FS406-22]|uniref:archaellin/type IV pilin N-terminal domain-containing protein n=1 Tax=Methanocaldococcus sp. (strain FS406-22) TaxID=644281 RepID=UPI0001BF1DDB|nr:archaellin/type IV pilin N-terminal domain-containing protein [Methanocaldococcus sp. FS406-22]ADC69035.1 conserved hypothetical protein [Methanocaldococcus sp. FS406-22]